MSDNDKVVSIEGRERRPKPPLISAQEMEKLLSDLGQLSPVEYGQKRFEIADKVGVPRSILDLEYRERRKNAKSEAEGGDADFLRDAGPWHKHVTGDELLTEIADAAAKHLVLPDGGAEIMALWAVFTHCHDCFGISPLLALTSPTPECGKTTCLTFLAGVSQRPLNTSNITSAALFRAVEKWTPTLFVDEADTFIRDSDELRGVINSGHQRSNAFVIRTVGDNHEPKRFRTWGPKAIALIGKLPATLASRAVHIQLKRMRPGDDPEPLREGRTSHLEILSRKAARWVLDHLDMLSTAEPKMPATLYARAADNWRPLFAIAGVAGGEWLNRITRIAAKLNARQEDLSVMLLHDVAAMFGLRGVDRLSSEEIVSALAEMEDRPWPEWKSGRPITRTQLAKVLGRFEIIPITVRLATGKTPKGYRLKSLSEALAHYPSPENAKAPQALERKEAGDFRDATPDALVAPKLEETSQSLNDCGVVAAKKPPDVDGDPFAALKDESLKLNPGLDEYPDLPTCLDRQRNSRPQDE
jgi:putative DNA primase/helicase